MKVRVVRGYTAQTGETRFKGDLVELSEASATRLIKRGRVVALSDTTKTSKRKLNAVKASTKK